VVLALLTGFLFDFFYYLGIVNYSCILINFLYLWGVFMKVLIVCKEVPRRETKEADIESWEEGLEMSPLKRFIIEDEKTNITFVFYSFYGRGLSLDLESGNLILNEVSCREPEEVFEDFLKFDKWDKEIKKNKGEGR